MTPEERYGAIKLLRDFGHSPRCAAGMINDFASCNCGLSVHHDMTLGNILENIEWFDAAPETRDHLMREIVSQFHSQTTLLF